MSRNDEAALIVLRDYLSAKKARDRFLSTNLEDMPGTVEDMLHEGGKLQLWESNLFGLLEAWSRDEDVIMAKLAMETE